MPIERMNLFEEGQTEVIYEEEDLKRRQWKNNQGRELIKRIKGGSIQEALSLT